jgi:hypothetical protein
VLSKRALIPHTHGGLGTHTHGAEGHTHDHEGVVIPTWAGGRFQTLAGAVFGLSGVRGLLLLLPLMARQRTVSLLLGVTLFGAGVVLSMFAVGWFAQRAAGGEAPRAGPARARRRRVDALRRVVGREPRLIRPRVAALELH